MKKVLRLIVVSSLVLFTLTPNLSKANGDGIHISQYFTDLGGSYAQDAISRLAEAGILNGMGDGTFDPTGEITRQDFAVILAKALGLDTTTPPSTQTFSDVPSNHYSFPYVEAAAEAGLFDGIGNSQFGLGSSLTKEQMAVVFVNALGADTSGMGSSLPFSDSDSISNWAKDAVAYAAEAGLITGTPDGNFEPLAPAERQQVALVASKFIDVIEENNPEPNPLPPIDPTPEPEPNPSPTPQPEPEPEPNPNIPTPQPEPNPDPNPNPNPNPNQG